MEGGMPKEIHIAVVIAAQKVLYLKQHLEHCHLWVASLDDKLNEHSYIVPGLGDAGDLAYGQNYN
jgi:uracil phosphoribosyltransferase